MNIVIVTLAVTTVGQGAYYNAQDIGLGRALNKCGHKVDIYDFVKDNAQEVWLSEQLCVHYVKCRSIGKHSLPPCDFITKGIDAVICFSDNQIGFGRLKKHCDMAGVPCYPYIGVLGSHSDNRLKRVVTNLLASNNRYYRNMPVLAKTPQVKAELEACGATNVTLVPVGLDEALLCQDYDKAGQKELRNRLKLPKEAGIILYLARLTPEKRPLEMLSIFADIYGQDATAHLVVIGKGKLQDAFLMKMKEMKLQNAVTYLEMVPNAKMWQYYRASDVMVNLNTGEIFGMAILEAMYYGCPVVARRAPGPELLIDSRTDGILCDSDNEIATQAEQLLRNQERATLIREQAHNKIMAKFLWQNSAKLIERQIHSNMKKV